uniref:Major facilitator superfamily (MFS) profile domain-containing protein n=1 Tax=Sinocyclocheilus grahami TaxID=75366 RepID=A0A672N342_SINGR
MNTFVLCPIGLFLPAAFLLAVGFTGCSGVLAVTFLTFSSILEGFSAAGVYINQIDIAPRYAGTLLGITNTFGMISGVLAPIVVGYLTRDVITGWRHVFWLSAGVSAFGAIFYVIFGTGKIQSWARTDEESDTDIHN